MLFALLPISVTAVLWYGISCAAWLGLLRTICGRMLVGLDPAAKRHATLAAGLLAMPLVIDGMCLGSFHVLMVWLMILGLDRACRGEETSGRNSAGNRRLAETLAPVGHWLSALPAEMERGPGRLGHRDRAGRRAERRGLRAGRRLAGTRALVATRRCRHHEPAIDVGQADG